MFNRRTSCTAADSVRRQCKIHRILLLLFLCWSTHYAVVLWRDTFDTKITRTIADGKSNIVKTGQGVRKPACKNCTKTSPSRLIAIVPQKSTQVQIKSDKTELILFTTAAFKESKRFVYETLFHLWKAWLPAIKPVMFTSDKAMKVKASHNNWDVMPETKIRRCKGMPLLPNMFLDAFKRYSQVKLFGFANGDIIFGNGLMETISFLTSKTIVGGRAFMMIGCRTNYDFVGATKRLEDIDEVKRLLPKGSLVKLSSDYFITSNLFPWNKIPALSIGRPGFARWVMSYAIKHKLPLIDTTRTVEALHLTTEDGNHSSWDVPKSQKRCNLNYMKSKERVIMDLGYVECATLYTARDKHGNIELLSRNRDRKVCKGYY